MLFKTRISVLIYHSLFKTSLNKTQNLSFHNSIINKIPHLVKPTMKSMGNTTKLGTMVWVDLEMTSLDISIGKIIEMACIVTNDDLDIIAEGPNLVIHHSDKTLNSEMSEWCVENFAKSGLTELSRNSKIMIEEAEQQMLEFIQKHTDKGCCPLAGNTVHEDKRFMLKYMPKFVDHLHYRIIDVSTLKELTRRWLPNTFKNVPKKKGKHRALDDIRESIEELKFYRNELFINK